MTKLFIYQNITSQEALKRSLKKYNIEDYQVLKNDYGYPYLKDIPLYFNISNKDEYTVLAISDTKVGVDIEKISYRPKMLNRYFTKEEKDYILKAENKDEIFTKIWVMKESYVKMLGIGLSYGLINVDTFLLKDYFHVKRNGKYYICLCYKP